MSTIFRNVAGTVVAVGSAGDQSARTGVVRIDGLTGLQHLIVTGFSISNSVSFRATPTIGGPNYLFSFGDNLAPISVDVMMFSGTGCLTEDGEQSELQGILRGFQFYAQNRLTPQRARSISIVYGGVKISGFLVGFNPESGVDGGSGRLVHRGSFRLVGVVDDSNLNAERAVMNAERVVTVLTPGVRDVRF